MGATPALAESSRGSDPAPLETPHRPLKAAAAAAAAAAAGACNRTHARALEAPLPPPPPALPFDVPFLERPRCSSLLLRSLPSLYAETSPLLRLVPSDTAGSAWRRRGGGGGAYASCSALCCFTSGGACWPAALRGWALGAPAGSRMNGGGGRQHMHRQRQLSPSLVGLGECLGGRSSGLGRCWHVRCRWADHGRTHVWAAASSSQQQQQQQGSPYRGRRRQHRVLAAPAARGHAAAAHRHHVGIAAHLASDGLRPTGSSKRVSIGERISLNMAAGA